MLNSPVTASLRGLCVVSDRVVWASGSGGTVLRTVDGGSIWTQLPVPDAGKLDFRDVHAFDEKIALLMTAGLPARFYRTDDGGITWDIVYETNDAGAFFDGMAFWDNTRGIAMSDPVQGDFLLIRTDDGGKTWKEVPPGDIDKPLDGEAGFAASGTSIAVGPDGLTAFGTSKARILRSTDWGHTWKAVAIPIQSGAPGKGVFSICFPDKDGHGVAVGGDFAADTLRNATAAYTVDHGSTWHPASTMPWGFRSCVTAVPGNTNEYLAVGTSGCDYSQDGGRTWKHVSDTGFHTVQCAPKSKHAFSTGSDGRIAMWILK
ncbi:oxidoreductase [bacterium]|nr:oxidoreductase [bacterium]